jgi:hypothetical protein
MNPAAFRVSHYEGGGLPRVRIGRVDRKPIQDSSVLYNFQSLNELQHAHSNALARSSVGEKATRRGPCLVVDVHSVCCGRPRERGPVPRFLQESS